MEFSNTGCPKHSTLEIRNFDTFSLYPIYIQLQTKNFNKILAFDFIFVAR